MNAPEIKILFISIVYIIAGVFVLAHYGQSISNRGGYVSSLLAFGVCQLNGNDPSCPNHEDIIDKPGIALNIVTFFLLGLVPLTSLSFAVKSSDIKRLQTCLKWSKKTSGAPTDASNETKKKDSLKAASTTLTNSGILESIG